MPSIMQWSVGALNVQSDHVHLFLSAPPSVAPSEIAPDASDNEARAARLQRYAEVRWSLDGAIRSL